MNPLWEKNISSEGNIIYLRCQKCPQKTRIYQPLKSVLFVCPGCGKIYSREKELYNKLPEGDKRQNSQVLPLYISGQINNIKYTVIGFASKRERANITANWEEYVLVDEAGNNAFLNQSNGHWIFLTERAAPKDYNPKTPGILDNEGNRYDHYCSYYHVTKVVKGEFPYDAIDVKKTYTREYISPPRIITAEEKGAERTFFDGHYLKPAQIKKSFAAAELSLPPREGVGACQPFYFGIIPIQFYKLSLLFLIFTLPFYLFLKEEPGKDPLATIHLEAIDSLRTPRTVSPTFSINDRPALLRFESSSSTIDNDWVEADITLVNESTGTERYFSNGLEYYHGYDDEGSWSEGNFNNTKYLGSVEPGRYHIEAGLITVPGTRFMNYHLSVYQDTTTDWNYWISIIFLAACCAIVSFGHSAFEKQRYE